MDLRIGIVLAALTLIAGCVATDVGPINTHSATARQNSPDFVPDPGDDGSTVVGLAFSGGGTRAAAFAYGVLRALDEIVIDEEPYTRTLVDDIRMVSGASGGAVAAAYFGYRGKDDYRDFRERFLLKDAESTMRTSKLAPVNLARALHGGVNDRSSFSRWLDSNLFDGATFESLKWQDAPVIWITASDIYNRVPFHFNYDTFAALCSDLDKMRLADAVAASAAVPVIFAPVVVSASEPDCGYKPPPWLDRALTDPDSPSRLQAYARALYAYQTDDSLRYVKLLDGGLTDNIGVTPFAMARASSGTPHGPLSPEEAVKLRTLLFLVADAGREAESPWAQTVNGPHLAELLQAVTDTTVSASVRDGFDALKLAVSHWRREIVEYRCGLPQETVRKYRGSTSGWDCRDVHLVVESLSFRDAEPAIQGKLNEIPTRLKLPADQVDLTISAGKTALHSKGSIRDAIKSIQHNAGVSKEMRVAFD
ncbi:MAG: patatin-like phospholipase family protein [Phyllobacterium sp.]